LAGICFAEIFLVEIIDEQIEACIGFSADALQDSA